MSQSMGTEDVKRWQEKRDLEHAVDQARAELGAELAILERLAKVCANTHQEGRRGFERARAASHARGNRLAAVYAEAVGRLEAVETVAAHAAEKER